MQRKRQVLVEMHMHQRRVVGVSQVLVKVSVALVRHFGLAPHRAVHVDPLAVQNHWVFHESGVPLYDLYYESWKFGSPE